MYVTAQADRQTDKYHETEHFR